MGTGMGKLAALGAAALVVTCLAACSSASSQGPGGSAAAGPTATPQLVSPKPLAGSAGTGPHVLPSPARLPGGLAGSQQVVLSDRTLTITSVTSQRRGNQGFVLIDLDLVVRNTSGKTIQNRSVFYQLLGAEGDTFGSEDNGSDNFYGVIDAHASRSGTIQFELPAAAATGLYLLYRPEIATEAVLTRLTIG